MKRALLGAVGSLALLVATTAQAQPKAPAGKPAAKPRKVWVSCAEHIPEGAKRPKLESKLPKQGKSGHELRLEVWITHGPGESVIANEFKIQRGSDAERAITDQHFVIPDPKGSAKPKVTPPKEKETASQRITLVSLPFVPLPKDPGRHVLTLPPVPIAVARANGEVMTLCTGPHSVIVEDPIANEVDPKVRPNAPARPQREEWVLAKNLAIAAGVLLVLLAVLAYILNRLRKMPRAEPPKPVVLPWIWAVGRLEEIKASTMLTDGEQDRYFDAVSDCLCDYLGRRYGFDGLESTSAEIRKTLARVYPPVLQPQLIEQFLEETDFVKFAEVEPNDDDCMKAMMLAEQIINTTTPPNAPRWGDEAERKKREQERRKKRRAKNKSKKKRKKKKGRAA